MSQCCTKIMTVSKWKGKNSRNPLKLRFWLQVLGLLEIPWLLLSKFRYSQRQARMTLITCILILGPSKWSSILGKRSLFPSNFDFYSGNERIALRMNTMLRTKRKIGMWHPTLFIILSNIFWLVKALKMSLSRW